MIFLCIDDDRDDLEFLGEALKEIDSNCSCHFARDGEEGINLLKWSIHPDLVFLDVNMPLMDGKQTLRAIRDNKEFNEIPICILSTTITSSDKLSFARMGANFCIEKASTYLELCNSIKPVVTSLS